MSDRLKGSEPRSMRNYDDIFENEFGHRLYTGVATPSNLIHHHDYYEIVIYLGTLPLRYVYEDTFFDSNFALE